MIKQTGSIYDKLPDSRVARNVNGTAMQEIQPAAIQTKAPVNTTSSTLIIVKTTENSLPNNEMFSENT